MNAFSRSEEQFIFRDSDDMMLERGIYQNGVPTYAPLSRNPSKARNTSTSLGGSDTVSQHSRPEPKLQSKVLLTQPSRNPDKKGFIRLDTYHDSSDVYRALAKIQEACDYGLNEEEELARMTSHDPSLLTGPWLKRKGRGAPMLMNDLSPDILLRCFSFCDLRSLGTLSSVNSRFYVLANTYSLWVPHAEARNIVVSDPRNARRELRDHVLEQRRKKDKEVLDCESEYERLALRMKERSEAIKSDPVDIERTLGSHNPGAILTGKYKRNSEGGQVLVSSSFVKKIQDTLSSLEVLRGEVMNQMDANNRLLTSQQDQLISIEQRLEGEKHAEKEASSTSSASLLTLSDFIAFERRMVRLIIQGSKLAAATTAPSECSDNDGRPPELPVALRRGITDFGTLDILCLDHSLPESVMNPVKTRYAAFKRFFPLNDDYYTVRALVESRSGEGETSLIPRKCEGMLDKTTSLVRRLQCMSDGELTTVVL